MKSIKRSAFTLILLGAAGTAAAQGSPTTTTTTDDETTTTTVTPPPRVDVDAPDIDVQGPAVNVYTPPPVVADTDYDEEDTLEAYGIALSLGGGVEDFTNDGARATTSVGGGWNVRASIGTRSPLAGEVSYIGSAQEINALGIDNDSMLVGNGLDAKARLNLLDWNVQPFVFAGVGWRHYNLTDEGLNTSAIDSSDDVLELPMGAGIAYKYRGFLLDARGEFRYATEENMLDGVAADSEMHRWGVNGNIGFAF